MDDRTDSWDYPIENAWRLNPKYDDKEDRHGKQYYFNTYE